MQVPDILFLTPSRDELLKLKLSVIRQKHMACVLRSCCLIGGVGAVSVSTICCHYCMVP